MVVGAYGCRVDQNKEALDLMAAEEVKVDWLITNEIEQGIRNFINYKGLKAVMK